MGGGVGERRVKGALLCCLLVGNYVSSESASAAPLKATGSVSISNTSTQAGGVSSSTRLLTGSVATDGYIYQPWLVTWGGGVSLSRNVSGASGSESHGNVLSGRLDSSVLPRSRFPLAVGYSVTDSRVEMQSEASPDGRLSDSRVRLLTIRQNFSTVSGNLISGWYNRADWQSTGVTENRAVSQSIGGNTSWRSQSQSLTLTGSAFNSENYSNSSSTDSANVSVSHNLTPQPQSGISSMVTLTSNNVSSGSRVTSDTRNLTATSNFYWRPDYRPASVSGSVNIRDSQSSGRDGAQSVGLNIGMSYAVSRSVRAYAGINGSVNQSGDARTAASSQSVGVNYTPEYIYIGKAVYNWGTGLSASNSVTQGSENSAGYWSLGGNFNHGLQRSWQLASQQVISQSFGQGVTGSWADTGQRPTGLSHSLRTSWTHSGENSTTTGWVAVTDTRQIGADTQSSGASANELRPATQTIQAQTLSASLRRTQNIDRLSRLSADITINASNMNGKTGNVSTSGTGEYSHSRLFGVYQLRFRSNLVLSQASVTQGSQLMTSRWDNRIDYSVGLMTLSTAFNMVQSGGASSRTLMFQMTRRF